MNIFCKGIQIEEFRLQSNSHLELLRPVFPSQLKNASRCELGLEKAKRSIISH